MNEVFGKLRIALAMQDYDQVISLAEQVIDQLHAVTKFSEQSGYEVGFYSEKEWVSIKTGSRDFCIGFAEASDASATCTGYYRVRSFGGFEIWPEPDSGCCNSIQ